MTVRSGPFQVMVLQLSCVKIIREKKTCRACIVALYKYAGILKNRDESSASRVLLKISKCLYKSTMPSEQFFLFFEKIINTAMQ